MSKPTGIPTANMAEEIFYRKLADEELSDSQKTYVDKPGFEKAVNRLFATFSTKVTAGEAKKLKYLTVMKVFCLSICFSGGSRFFGKQVVRVYREISARPADPKRKEFYDRVLRGFEQADTKRRWKESRKNR